jgi:hypothetical protein
VNDVFAPVTIVLLRSLPRIHCAESSLEVESEASSSQSRPQSREASSLEIGKRQLSSYHSNSSIITVLLVGLISPKSD